MATRSILLGTTAIAALALAACNNSNDGLAAVAEAGDPGPLGLVFDTSVDVISSDHQNSVRVSEELASMELVSLDLVAGTFEIELGLPDGTLVTLTQDDLEGFTDININGGDVLLAELENDDGDLVQVAIGLGLATNPDDLEAEDADRALFMLARVDDADPVAEPSALNYEEGMHDFDVYMLTGVETDTLPEGAATYSGETIATAYVGGDLVSSYFHGSANIAANFESNTVSVDLKGSYVGNIDGYEVDASYRLVGEDLAVEGSRYRGALGITDDIDDVDVSTFTMTTYDYSKCLSECGNTTTTALDGDLIGAFFGDNAEATAGVFAATETDQEAELNLADVEIVGGYGAYTDVIDGNFPD